MFKRRKSSTKTGRNPQDRSSKNSTQRVISYYTASRQQLDSFDRRTAAKNDSSPTARRLHSLRRAWFTLFAAVVLIAVLGYSLTLSREPVVIVNGDLYRSSAEYEEIARNSFGNDPRNLLKPTLQEASLASVLRTAFPEARNITVKSSLLGHRPEVIIDTDKPLAILSQPSGKSVVLGERGRLLLPTDEALESFLNLPKMTNSTSVILEPGSQFIRPNEAVAYKRLLAQYAAEDSLPTSEIVAVPQEILIREPSRGGYYVRYLLNDTIVQQFGALRATQKNLQQRNEIPAEYIDVRLAEKAFYK